MRADHLVLQYLLEAHLLAGRQGMPDGHHQGQLVVPVGEGFQPLRRGLRGDDAKVGAPVGNCTDHRRAYPLFDVELDRRIQLGKAGQVLRQELRQRRGNGMDTDMALDPAGVAAQLGIQLGHGLLELAGVEQ
ncbi:hypothetical protein D3C78_1315830 [compost metagenome]